jgi:hypothetical protein
MKRAISVAVVALVSFSLGCSKSSPTISKAPPGRPNGTVPQRPAPEVIITRFEGSDDKATYLEQLAKDSSFDPKQHVPMLQKYADDPDPTVAQKAKELLDRH